MDPRAKEAASNGIVGRSGDSRLTLAAICRWRVRADGLGSRRGLKAKASAVAHRTAPVTRRCPALRTSPASPPGWCVTEEPPAAPALLPVVRAPRRCGFRHGDERSSGQRERPRPGARRNRQPGPSLQPTRPGGREPPTLPAIRSQHPRKRPPRSCHPTRCRGAGWFNTSARSVTGQTRWPGMSPEIPGKPGGIHKGRFKTTSFPTRLGMRPWGQAPGYWRGSSPRANCLTGLPSCGQR